MILKKVLVIVYKLTSLLLHPLLRIHKHRPMYPKPPEAWYPYPQSIAVYPYWRPRYVINPFIQWENTVRKCGNHRISWRHAVCRYSLLRDRTAFNTSLYFVLCLKMGMWENERFWEKRKVNKNVKFVIYVKLFLLYIWVKIVFIRQQCLLYVGIIYVHFQYTDTHKII